MSNKKEDKTINEICFEDWGLYNAGAINCKWWPAGTKAEEGQEFLEKRRLKAGVFPADDLEIFVSDTSLNWPGEIVTARESVPEIISEHCGIDDALNILELFDAASDDELKAAAYLLYMGFAEEFEGAIDKAQDVHIIDNDYSMKNEETVLGYYWADNGLIEVPEHLESYIDWEQIGRELIINGPYCKFAGDIYEYTN